MGTISDTKSAASMISAGCAAACEHHMLPRVASLQEVDHDLRVQVAQFHDHVDLVEDHQIIFARLDGFLAHVPDFQGRGDILLGVLGIPGEAVTHGADLHIGRQSIGQLLLTGLPLALDVLDHEDLVSHAQGPERQAQRRRRLPLAIARIHEDQAVTPLRLMRRVRSSDFSTAIAKVSFQAPNANKVLRTPSEREVPSISSIDPIGSTPEFRQLPRQSQSNRPRLGVDHQAANLVRG